MHNCLKSSASKKIATKILKSFNETEITIAIVNRNTRNRISKYCMGPLPIYLKFRLNKSNSLFRHKSRVL